MMHIKLDCVRHGIRMIKVSHSTVNDTVWCGVIMDYG